MIMDIKGSIDDTRKGFEESFAAGEFYNRKTQDSDHLKKILGFVKISEGMKILDLGTGRGYLSFPIAKSIICTWKSRKPLLYSEILKSRKGRLFVQKIPQSSSFCTAI